METVRSRTVIGVLVIMAAMVGGLAYTLAHSQAQARSHQVADLGRKAALTARLTGGALGSGGSSAAAQFSGPAASLPRSMTQWEQVGGYDARASIYGPAGQLLTTWRGPNIRGALPPIPAALMPRALAGSQQISDIAMLGSPKVAYVWLLTPFKTPFGRRVLASLSQADTIASFAAPYLKTAPSVSGATAYLLDGANRVLGASDGTAQGRELRGLTLAATSQAAHARTGASAAAKTGAIRSRTWASAPIKAGTDWSILFTAPTATLLASANHGNVLAWTAFGAFVLALLVLLAVARSAVRASAALAGSRAREAAARALTHERLHDTLTGLPNRALFLDRASLAMSRTQRHGRALAVLFANIDRFQRINDSLGHVAGDALLVMLGDRMRSAVRPGDTVSRFGGDEFLILCDDLTDEDDALGIAARVSEALAEPLELCGREVRVSCCIGVALYEGEESKCDAADLIRDADVAMYGAKAAGGGSTTVFEAGLHTDAVRRLDFEVALRSAVARDQIDVHYQPIVELPSGRLAGVEALARWRRPGEGWIAPPEFIGLAEEMGLIGELGLQVLRRSLADVEAWRADGLIDPDFLLSVNVSPRQLCERGFAISVEAALAEAGCGPTTLCLEITESAVVDNPVRAEAAIKELHQLGVRLAIDDFGVGLSSLSQLVQSLQVDIVKLDQSFVANISRERERAVVAAVASMADGLGMSAIAEGVERPDQFDALVKLGYRFAQGYLFGRPMPAETLRCSVVNIDEITRVVA